MKNSRLKFPKLDRHGIPLRQIISVHHQFEGPLTLKRNLGDAFLYRMNPIFQNIREEFAKLGFSYHLGDLCHYYSFPLMCLDEIIAKRRVPYLDNIHWLESLEKSSPGRFTLTEIKRCDLKFNYVFHESAHFIAYRVFFGRKRIFNLPKSSNTILGILLGEAFANTVEALAIAFVEGEIGSYFLDANCHFRSGEEEADAILRAAKEYGFEVTARVLLASFLYSNFLYKKIGTKELQRIATFAGLQKNAKISDLVKIGLELDDEFRTTTTQLHLLKQGFATDFASDMQFDPVEVLLVPEFEPFRTKALHLTAIACRDIKGQWN